MNQIKLSGTRLNNPEFSHEVNGESFYEFSISIARNSGTLDAIICIISEIYLKAIKDNTKLAVIGEIRTRNICTEDGKSRLQIFVFVNEVLPYLGEINVAEIHGYLCKKPTLRTTPLGRQISETIIASNRNYGKSDYIPCISWGRSAAKTCCYEVGTELIVTGRFQSRKYTKKLDDGTEEIRTAYELSAHTMEETKESEELL